MSTSRYFSCFPIINYANLSVIDITDRVIFTDNTLKNPYVFYPYDVSDSERADQFADRYYSDSYKAWILYLSNQIIDPYYDWYQSEDNFNKFVILKYGSILLAQSKIAYYENNWYSGNNISKSAYNALPDSLFKYYTPLYDLYNNITGYSRAQSNDTITTNGIRSYTVSTNTFVRDELVNIVFNQYANVIGNGQIMAVSGNTIYVQHIIGNTVANTTSNSFIYGQESQTNASLLSSSIVCDNLLPEEEIYWSPVSYYDMESAKNESKKTIRVLDSSLAPQAASSLKNLLAS